MMPTLLQPSAPVRSANWFVEKLISTRLVNPQQLGPYLVELRTLPDRTDAVAAAEFLVEAGLLSAYQADRILADDAEALLLGPYQLVQPLGQGSMGKVFQALGRTNHKHYAVKVLPLRSLWNVHLAKKQVRLLATLPHHAAIVPMVDVDTAGGRHYLAWPFVQGTTLAQLVEQNGPLTVPKALEHSIQVAEGLLLLHQHGVAHGLLKPTNILLGQDGHARILDLGIGAILSENIADDESMLDTISTANAAISLLDYAAPETLNSPMLRAPAGDVYSLGCVLHFLLTGTMPFPQGNAVDKILAHQTQQPRPLRLSNSAVPNWLDWLVFRMMAKSPEHRPDMAAVLAALLAEQFDPPPPETIARRFDITPAPLISEPTPPISEPTSPISGLNDSSSPAKPQPQNEADPVSQISEADPDSQISFDELPPVSTFADPRLISVGKGFKDQTSVAGASEVGGFVDWASVGGQNLGGPLPEVFGYGQESVASTDAEVEAPKIPEMREESCGWTGVRDRPLELPPLPSFARSIWWRLYNRLSFWRPQANVVQFSIFGPAAISPGDNASLQVFAHDPEAFESVLTLAGVFHNTGELLASGYVQRAVRPGQRLALHLGIVNAGLQRPLVELTWRGQPLPRKFDLFVPWDSPAGPRPTVLSVGLNARLVARIAFRLQILPRRR